MFRCLVRASAFSLFTLLITSLLHAQDDELNRGLIAQFITPDQSVQRVDPDVAFHWGNQSPHSSLHGEAWKAAWSGQLLIRSLTPYQFHAQLQGSVKVSIDGEIVLESSTETPQWISGNEVSISPGFQELQIEFQPAKAGAEVKLFWSNSEFAVEPIPSHLYFHEEEDSQAQLIEQGRQLVDSHHCSNCHRDSPTIDELDKAPALWGVVSGTNPEWIVQKLMGTHPEAESDEMPHFELTQTQAEDISAYFHRLEAPFDLTTSPDPKLKKGELTGKELFNSSGCLACHKVDELGNDGTFSGPVLSQIGNKRSADWIATWLASPDRLNPQHTMPIFKLSRSERGRIAHYLSSLGKKKGTSFGRSNSKTMTEASIRGQALVKEFQCANCHKIPAIEAARKTAAPLTKVPADWENSCLATKPAPDQKRPHFPFLDRKPIEAYLGSLGGKPAEEPSLFAKGQRVIERRQCLACHSRGANDGLKSLSMEIAKATPSLNGQTQLVIPPSLNAVGDKLQDSVLDVAVSGKQDRVRADWLKVQMPQFHHSDQELAAIKHYLVEHDRIPAAAAVTHPKLDLSQSDLLLIGRKLVGAGGWSCIACHQIGDYVPKNTALGTRGSDLMAIGKRLRPEFYYRWTRSPIRVIPGMEMPSFTKPVSGVLHEDVHQQLAAIFAAVNDPKFEPPTNPSQVEQLWQVTSDSPPRIVRDVFTVRKENGGGAVARAMGVGFNNQHGVLFDLDRATVRDWSYGDFASQRTVGKSWYWDLAGVSLVKGLNATNDLVLLDKSDKIVELNGSDPDRIAHLKSYEVSGNQLKVNYDLKVKLPEGKVSIPVREVIESFQDESEAGWTRKISPLELPAGYRLAWRPKSDLVSISNSKISAVAVPQLKSSSKLPSVGESTNGQHLLITYQSEASSPQTPLPVKPSPLAITDKVTTWPGQTGVRLPIPISLMPTAIAADDEGRLLVTSLKGHVYRISDRDGDGIEEYLELIQEGLSAPFGIASQGKSILVAHKPELIRLIDEDNDGVFEKREIVADGWGHSDNYHDWVTGPVFDENGAAFVATGSDYAQPKRDRALIKWRGKVVRAGTDGTVEPYAHELRYPIGIAKDSQGRIFVSDQQGVQNTFNEINQILPGGAYGVPGQDDGDGAPKPHLATIQIPHPWTRSVNGIFFIPDNNPGPFAGHGVGCEFNGKFLIRFTMHEVDGELQGACYPLTQSTWENEANTFLGPIAGFASKDGSVYIGSLYDSGWLGGPNVGEVVKVQQTGDPGNGIREVRAVPGGFTIEFIKPVDPALATNPKNYALSGYTRIWQGSYGTDDSGRYSPPIEKATLSADQKTVTLQVSNLKPTYVYEFNVNKLQKGETVLFPSFAAYTLNRIPE